jgi:hypothetical protein
MLFEWQNGVLFSISSTKCFFLLFFDFFLRVFSWIRAHTSSIFALTETGTVMTPRKLSGLGWLVKQLVLGIVKDKGGAGKSRRWKSLAL